MKAAARSVRVRSRAEASEGARSVARDLGGALNSRNLKVDNDSNVRIIRDNRQRKQATGRKIAWG